MRHVLVLIVAILLAGLGGCSAFQAQFDQSAMQGVDAAQPLVGAYKGTWTSGLEKFGGEADVIFVKQADPASPAIWLRMWTPQFLWIKNLRAELQTTRVKVDAPVNGEVAFHAKLAEGALRVLKVDGWIKGNTLTIQYESLDTTDTDVQHEKGEMVLTRVKG